MTSPYTQTGAPVAGPAATTPMPDPLAGGRAERALGRRSSLPGGRALLGAALVVAAAVMVYAAYVSATAKPANVYVVAKRDLQVNDRLSLADLQTVTGDLPGEVADGVFTTPSELDGAVVLAPVAAHALVPRTAVLAADARPENGADDYEISFTSPNWKLGGGRLRPGELIDLVPTDDSKDTGRIVPAVRGVRVVSLIGTGGGGGLGAGSDESVVTVAAADPPSYQAIVNVVRGQFWVVRATRAPGADRRPGAGGDPAATVPSPLTTTTTAVPTTTAGAGGFGFGGPSSVDRPTTTRRP